MTETYYLSDEEKQFFSENGYVGPFTLFQPQEMEELWARVRMDILDRSGAAFPESKLNYDRHLDLPELNGIISHPRIVHRMASLLGPNVLSWRTEWFPKYPGDEGTDWHQAQSFVEFEGVEKLIPTIDQEPWELTAWVAMSDASRENGCLKLMPGSHRTWYFDEKKNIPFEPENLNKRINDAGQQSGFYGYNYDLLKVDKDWKPDEDKAKHMEVKAGQFFIFTSRTMHGSNPNTSESSVRFGWATRFVPTHVKVYHGQDSFHHFGEVLPLDKYSTVLVAGEDTYGHNRVRQPLTEAQTAAV